MSTRNARAPKPGDTQLDFVVGAPKRPAIRHDNGFLQLPLHAAVPPILNFPIMAARDTAWSAAERLKHDIPDGLAAYHHYLYGVGRNREFSYEKYVSQDEAGRITLQNGIADSIAGTERLFRTNFEKQHGPIAFSMTSSAIGCGASNSRYPYPRTPNWRFTIGAHFIWISADVHVKRTPTLPEFKMDFVIHAEDRYNFNPGQKAIDTLLGIHLPDKVNGLLFERTGYGTPYMHYATLMRTVSWSYGIRASTIVRSKQK